MKIKLLLSLLLLLLLPSVALADTWAGASARQLDAAGLWESGSGTAKVIKFPAKYTAPMINGAGTITKWGTVGLALTNINPLLNVLVTGGLMVGTYYFDQWLNNRQISYNPVDGYNIGTALVEGENNLGTVTPTSGHRAYYYKRTGYEQYSINHGYYPDSTSATAARDADVGRPGTRTIGTYTSSVLFDTTIWRSRVVRYTTATNVYKDYYYQLPATGTPYTEGGDVAQENIGNDEFIDLIRQSVQASSEISRALKQFLELHEASINYYLEHGVPMPGSTLTSTQLQQFKDRFKLDADAATIANINALDYVGAPTIEENTNPYTPAEPVPMEAEDIAQAVDVKARALDLENKNLDSSTAAESETALNGLTLPDMVGAYTPDEAIQPTKTIDNVIDYLIANSPITSIFQAVAVTSTGACEFTFAYKERVIKFGVCAFSDFLDMWALLMASIVSLHCLFILFRRG